MSSGQCHLTSLLARIAMLLLFGVSSAMAQSPGGAPGADNRAAENPPDETKSLTEVNKELSNPISSIWSLTFQQNAYWLTMPSGHSDRNQINLQFQPVLPVALTKNWNLINRPVLQPLLSMPYINRSGNLDRVTGFGDAIFVTMLSPSESVGGQLATGGWPDFIFPTASNSRLGQDKWQLGPAGVIGYLGEKLLAELFPQQWWSTGGSGKNTISQLNLQYFATYLFGKGYSVGFSPNMLVNWYANKSSNMVTFPIGLSLAKVQRLGILPVRFAVQGQDMPAHPDAFGQKWNIQVIIAPVIPKLIKGDLLE